MTAPPDRIISGRRTAGGILVLSALATVIMLVTLVARCSADPQQPPSRALAASPYTPATTAASPQQTTRQQPVSAQAELQREAARDRTRVEALIGSWVPQLSSKTIGLKADGITYDYRDILDHFDRTKTRYPLALLLYSDDYTSYAAKDHWVIVIPTAYSNGSAANAWCDSQRIDPDNCYAKLLLHTGGPDGTTLLRK